LCTISQFARGTLPLSRAMLGWATSNNSGKACEREMLMLRLLDGKHEAPVAAATVLL